MQETWVWYLGQENPLEKGMQPTAVFLFGQFRGQRSLAGSSPWGHIESGITEWLPLLLFTFQYWSWSFKTLATWCKAWTHWKRLWCWERWRQEKREREDELVGWYHWFNGHEFEQTLGDSDEQGILVCCSPCGCKESDMTWLVNNNNSNWVYVGRLYIINVPFLTPTPHNLVYEVKAISIKTQEILVDIENLILTYIERQNKWIAKIILNFYELI